MPGYTVQFIHDGTDVGVLDATEADLADEIYDDHADAVRAAKELATCCRWYDLSEKKEGA